MALRRGLQGIPVERIEQPGDRFLIRLGADASIDAAVERVERVLGVAYYAVVRPVERDMDAICGAAWDEIEPLRFSSFAVRAHRSDKSFPQNTLEIERIVGRHLLETLRARGSEVRVKLKDPEITCHIEITPGPALVYARKIPGAGGLPANTAGRITCLLSGGYDSAVAAYQMMKRGAHLSFVHFYGTGARPGESSLHVASGLARQLVRYQFNAKLYRVPFEAIQREIVRYAPEEYRILLYRRMMLRISEAFARRSRALALLTGDSLGQVASQTLAQPGGRGCSSQVPLFRPLIRTGRIRHYHNREENSDVRHFLGAVSRLLPRLHATAARALREPAGFGRGRIEARYSRADYTGSSRHHDRAIQICRRGCGSERAKADGTRRQTTNRHRLNFPPLCFIAPGIEN